MSKSNQHATLHRVTLLESIAGRRNDIESTTRFHKLGAGRDRTTGDIFWLMYEAYAALRKAERLAAELEAWGDGP